MGIGGHVDHLITLRAVMQHYEHLRSRYEIVFYEDLFYASHLDERVRGILRFREIVRPLMPRRWSLPVRDCAEKLELIRLYRSQFSEPPENLTTFNPAKLFNFDLHEAVWTVGA